MNSGSFLPGEDPPQLPRGLYERLLDEELAALLKENSQLRSVIRPVEDAEFPDASTQHLGKIILLTLRSLKPARRTGLVNKMVELLAEIDGCKNLLHHRLLPEPKILESLDIEENQTRPSTPLRISSLLTGAGGDPPLEHELRSELSTADRVDILVSFVKYSGLRLLIPGFELLRERKVEVRFLTTSYMGASDAAAIDWLSRQSNIRVRVSYDTSRTRLHAKAYHFFRNSGFSTAYIGSANMSHTAMTSGLEWTVKVTAQDMPHILERFSAEFESYWAGEEFCDYDSSQLERLSTSLRQAREGTQVGQVRFFADIRPHPFQERILEALAAARTVGDMRNLVVAATGTGKTVIAAFDYARYRASHLENSTLLFVAHRKEILEQALDCFRTVLRDPNFGALFVGGAPPSTWSHVFASIQSLNNEQPWKRLGPEYYRMVIVDEAHHGTADSYQPLFHELSPDLLLGLTATPERMDGTSILPDFGYRFTAEIRLAEALEQKLLCPFHYFGVTDPVSLADERFWRNGKYQIDELTKVYTGDDIKAQLRLDVIFKALARYLPILDGVRAVGFCASIKHAEFMAEAFCRRNFTAETVTGNTPPELRTQRIQAFREGRLSFLFTVDVLSEGVDVPEINLVLFLRPTESLTVFLQQLGRGLRHFPGKECLTVLDFVGQTHRKYRVERRLAALLTRQRFRLDTEVEHDFPHIPPGCSLQLERVARDYVLASIRKGLQNLRAFVTESIRTFESEHKEPLSLNRFLEVSEVSPIEIFKLKSWSEWIAEAFHRPPPGDPHLAEGRKALARICLRTAPRLLAALRALAEGTDLSEFSDFEKTALYYLLWSRNQKHGGPTTLNDSLARARENPSLLNDFKALLSS